MASDRWLKRNDSRSVVELDSSWRIVCCIRGAIKNIYGRFNYLHWAVVERRMFRQKRGGKREGLRSSSSSGIHWYFIATCLGFAFFTSVLASTTLDAIASAEQNTIFLYSNSFRHGHAERWWDDKGVYNNMRKKNRLSSFPATNVLQWRNFRGGGSGTSRPRMGNIALSGKRMVSL